MENIYIVDIKRTAVGKYHGALSTISPSDFGASVVKEIVKNNKLDTKTLDEVIVGNILSAGHGQNIGRQVSIKGGIDESVGAYTINILCGSGLKSVMQSYTNIKAGISNAIIAGGVESMSQSAYILPSSVKTGTKIGHFEAKDTLISDGLMDIFNNIHMGVTAENIAEKYNITRKAQDEFAFTSQTRAIKAQKAGKFKSEIVPIIISSKKGDITFSEDEFINHETTLEKLSTLRTAFKKDGTVTAGNASGINDGAGFALVVSESYMKKHNLTPLVKIIGIGQAGVDPKIMGMGPVDAISKALNMSKLKLSDINYIELNEAFAAQSLGVLTELSQQHSTSIEKLLEKTNLNGGAIAIGHPLGASGTRILSTLVYEMIREKHKYGLASLCIGGGMGVALIVEKV